MSNLISMERVWAMPSRWTFEIEPIKRLLNKYNVGIGWVDPFCGKSKLAETSNDIARGGMDAHDFVLQIPNNSKIGALFDPPYSMEQVKRSYNSAGINQWQKIGNNKNGSFPRVKDRLAQIIAPGGYCISFGWNSNGLGKSRGFYVMEVLLVAHGGNRHDTICTVERRRFENE